MLDDRVVTFLAGLPFSGPIGATRVALIDGQWVGFPTHSELERATFDMVVAGRVVGDDVAIMMVEAEATTGTIDMIAGGAKAPTETVVAEGLEASKVFIKALCDAQQSLANAAAKPVGQFPVFLDYQDDVYDAVSEFASAKVAQALTIVGKAEREEFAAAVAASGPPSPGRSRSWCSRKRRCFRARTRWPSS